MEFLLLMRKRIFLALVVCVTIFFSGSVFSDDYMNEAKQYISEGKHKSAIIQLKNLLKEDPKNAQARLLLGQSYLEIGSINQADKEINKAYQLNNANEDILLAYTQLLLMKRKFEQVNNILNKTFSDPEKEYQRQIQKANALLGLNQLADAKEIFLTLTEQQDDVQAFVGLAKIAIMEKEMDDANLLLDKALKTVPGNPEALKIKAKIEVLNKNYTNALNIYNDLINKQEDMLLLYIERAKIKQQLEDFDGAERDVQKILAKVNNNPQANALLAQLKLQQRNFKDANLAAQKVLNIIPNHIDSMLVLGISHFGLRNYNQADKYLTQYLSVNPDNIEIQSILANVYLAQKNPDQALLILEGIDEEKRKNNARVLMTLGSAYLLMGEHNKGLSALNEANALEPDNKDVQKKLVVGQITVGDMENAIIRLEKITDSELADIEMHYLLVVTYIGEKKLTKAENKLNELVNKYPDNPDLYHLIAIVEKLNGDNEKAKRAYKKALQLNAQYIPAYLGLAGLAAQQKDFFAAREYYHKVVQINPKYIKAYIYLAAIAEKENQPNEIIKQLTAGIENSAGQLKAQLVAANILSNYYVRQKRPEDIMPIAKKLMRSYPNNTKVMSFLVSAQIVNGMDAEAEQLIRTILAKDNKDIKHRLMLAGLLEKKVGNEQEILDLLDSAINLSPTNHTLLIIKANYLLENKKITAAMKLADYAEKQFPDLTLGKQLKADIYRIEKKFDEALFYYKAVYKIQPGNKLLFIIVDILDYQGKEDEAFEFLSGGLTKTDADFTIHYKMAYYLEKKQRYKKAIEHYKKMLDIKPDNALALNNIAWSYYKTGQLEDAVINAKNAYELAPKSAQVIDTYGYILVRQGDIDKGVELLEQAVKLAPKPGDIQFHLAEGYYKKGEVIKSKDILVSLLKSNAHFREKESAEILLNKIR